MSDVSWASTDEARKIEEVVKDRAFPAGVRATGFDLTFGEDQTGHPGVWILLSVDKEYENPSSTWIAEVRNFVNRLRNDLLKEDLRHWPYVGLKPPS